MDKVVDIYIYFLMSVWSNMVPNGNILKTVDTWQFFFVVEKMSFLTTFDHFGAIFWVKMVKKWSKLLKLGKWAVLSIYTYILKVKSQNWPDFGKGVGGSGDNVYMVGHLVRSLCSLTRTTNLPPPPFFHMYPVFWPKVPF